MRSLWLPFFVGRMEEDLEINALALIEIRWYYHIDLWFNFKIYTLIPNFRDFSITNYQSRCNCKFTAICDSYESNRIDNLKFTKSTKYLRTTAQKRYRALRDSSDQQTANVRSIWQCPLCSITRSIHPNLAYPSYSYPTEKFIGLIVVSIIVVTNWNTHKTFDTIVLELKLYWLRVTIIRRVCKLIWLSWYIM